MRAAGTTVADDGGVKDAPVAEGPEDRQTGAVGLDVGRLTRIEVSLGAVEAALERLDDGTWGTCETCGEPVDRDALDEDPTSRSCRRHR